MSTLGSINAKIGADTSGLVAGANRARDAMGRFIPLAQQAGGAVSGFGQRANEAAGGVRKFGDANKDSANSIEGLVKSLGGAAAQILAVKAATGAAWGALKGIIQTTADFDQKMSKVAAVSGAVGDEFGILRKAAIDLGSATVFSASEVADGMAVLAAAGISDTNAILAAMPGLLDTAAASGADFTTATEIAAGAMNAFKLQASDMGHVGDVLASAAQMSQVSMTDLGYSLKYVGPVAQASGISLEGTAAALTVLGDSAIKGEQAGTTLRAILASLTAPSGEAAAKMKELGLNAFDSTGHMLKLSEISGMFHERLKGMTEQQRNAAIATIFGREAMSGAIAIVGKGQQAFADLEGQFGNVDGAAHKMAETMTDNLNGAVEQFNGQVEALAITLGTPLTNNLKEATKGATGFLTEINVIASNGFELLGKAADKAGLKLGGVFPSPLKDATAFLGVIGGIIEAMNSTDVRGLGSGWANSLNGLASLIQNMDPTIRDTIFGKSNFVPIPTQGRAAGGLISGPGTGTSDSIVAWLSNGEGINTAAAMSKPQNRRAMDFMNAGGTIPGFASGGMVGYGATASADDYAMAGLGGYSSPAALALDASTRTLAIAVAKNVKSMIASQSAIAAHAASVTEVTLTLDDSSSVIKTAANSFSGVGADMSEVSADITEMADSVELTTYFLDDAAKAQDAWTDAAWATAAECENASTGVRTFADSAQRAAQATADAAEAARKSAEDFGTTGDFMKDIGYGAGSGQRAGDLSVHSLDGMTIENSFFVDSFEAKIKAVSGSFSANVEAMFPSMKNAQKMFNMMNTGNLWAQGLNTFLDFGALKSMQEGNLRLLAVMEKGGEALNREWLDSLMGTSAAWSDQLLQQTATIGQATEAQGMATEATRTMSDSLIQATDSVSGSFVAAGEGVLASAAATAGAGEWMANTFLASGQVVNRAAASMSAGLASASSGVLSAASAAVSAIGSQLAQIGAGSGLSELARQMQNAGLTGAVESTLPGGSPSGLETSGGSMGSSRGNSRNGGGWVSGGYGQLPPIVLVLDGKEVHTSVQGYGNYYGAGNVSGGFS